MSINVQGFTTADDPEYIKHLAVWNACNTADVEIPSATQDYFDYGEPEGRLIVSLPVTEWADDNGEGYELFIKDIPTGVTKIRFSASW